MRCGTAKLRDHFLREQWLAKRLAEWLPTKQTLFDGTTDLEIRKARARVLIHESGLHEHEAGKNGNGEALTFARVFSDVYGESL